MRLMIPLLFCIACGEGGGLAPLADLGQPPRASDTGVQPSDSGRQDAADHDAAMRVPDVGPDLGPDVMQDVVPADAGPDSAPDSTPDVPPLPPMAAVRGCTTTVRFKAPPGTREVLLAGDFTGWADAPIPLADPDGDGTFERELSTADGLVLGQVHPYKIIADGNWRINPSAALRKYDGDCVNGGVQLPACDSGPYLLVQSATVTNGTLTLDFVPQQATDGVPVTEVSVSVDGREPAETVATETGLRVITPLEPGKHRVVLNAMDANGRSDETVVPIWSDAQAFDWRSTVLYLLFIDRFANGSRENDRPVGGPVAPSAEWHGGDLEGALAVLESGYFERLGARAIWLSPINAQVDGHFPERAGGGMRIAAYHGYWPIKGREVEARFGGNEALRAFVDAAHQRGIRVLFDLINNQVHEQHEYVAPHPEWFRSDCVCGQDPGCGWSERPLECLFAEYLPDINWRNPGAEQRFVEDALFWIEEFDVDGFRVDAVKHVETTSVYNLRAAIQARYGRGGERIIMLGETAVGEGDSFADGCGEFYGDGYDWISAYTGPTALDGQFDFPTHHRISWGLLTGNASYRDIEGSIAQMQARYASDALHVAFLGSHDSTRMQTVANQHPAAGCRWPGDAPCDALPDVGNDPALYQRLRRAWTLLLTIPMMPLLYYGDDIALPGAGDPDNRRPMPWTGDLAALAMTDEPVSAAQVALRTHLEALANVRASHPAIASGARTTLLVEDDLYVFARHTADDAVVVVLNRGAAVVGRNIQLGVLAGRDLAVEVGSGQVQIDDGSLTIDVAAGEALVLGSVR